MIVTWLRRRQDGADETSKRLALAEKVAEAARWACVAALDADTPAAEMAEIRPLAAEELVEALRAYDEHRETHA